jgi:hypothetical protein
MNPAVARIPGVTALRSLVPVLVFVLAAAAGCGGSDDPPGSDDGPVLTNGALVSYTRAGGVGGVDERLRIDPDGAATISIGAPEDAQRTFQLSDAELARIQSLLDAADLGAVPANPQPTGCADCFVYTVEYGGRTITYDDASPPPASVGELVTGLTDLAEANHPASAGFIKGG